MHINIPTPIANDDSKVCITENKMEQSTDFFLSITIANTTMYPTGVRFSSFSSSSKHWPKELLKEKSN